jgi:hypothetical protein
VLLRAGELLSCWPAGCSLILVAASLWSAAGAGGGGWLVVCWLAGASERVDVCERDWGHWRGLLVSQCPWWGVLIVCRGVAWLGECVWWVRVWEGLLPG